MGTRRHYRVLAALFLGTASTALHAGELNLKPETVNIWDGYERAAIAAMQQRLHGDGPFLRVDRNPERLARLRAGEIVVWPAVDNPKRICSGLIHDWIGAVFIPNARIADLLAVVRDYGNYKQIYKPGVLGARLEEQSGGEDHFSIVLRNPSFFTKTALDGGFESTYTEVSPGRWYGVTRSLRLQEIDNYGQAGQLKLPPDRGHGYIWRMTSLSQMEERGGGIYIEEEVLALSRDVPAAIRWMADPVIRRVARDSTALSLGKTRAAVCLIPEVISANRRSVTRGE